MRGMARSGAFALVLVLVLGPSIAASDPAVHALLAEVRIARRRLRGIDAAFEQEKEMALFRETLRARGRLRVLGPDRLRWDTEAPDRSSFVYDRGTVVFRASDGRVESLGATGLFGAVLGDLVAFIAGDLADLDRRYRLEARPGPGGTVTLVARPSDRAVRRHVREVRVEFARDRRRLRSLALLEANGDRSTIRFTRFRTDARIAPDVFRL